MSEDLYTGKITIRQVRQSYVPEFPMKQIWEELKRMGGPGIKEEKNYLICPSSALSNIFINKLNHLDTILVMQVIGQLQAFSERYAFTMLIQD